MRTKAFRYLEERIKENYLGKPVPIQFKKEFGKIYNKKDIPQLTLNIAKSRGVQINQIQTGQGVNKWKKDK